MVAVNAAGREIPDGVCAGRPLFEGAFARMPKGRQAGPLIRALRPGQSKIVGGIEEAIKAAGVKNGMTLSFHHHLRDGDYILNMVVDACARLGVSDLTIATSSVFGIHAPLVEHIRSGTVTGIEANYIVGPVGEAICQGLLPKICVLRSHGGRVRAIEAGELHIDVAFVAAPTLDPGGNMNGVDGPSACGSLGYAVADARYADRVIAITDNLVDYPVCPISIPGSLVDMVVAVDKIGDPKGIVSGSIRVTRDPMGLLIAKNAARVIEASGLLRDGFSFQTGAGGASLAVASFLRRQMRQQAICGSFGLGGITEYFVSMLNEGLFKSLLDTQDFDMAAIKSLKTNPAHQEIDCGTYANPHNPGAVVNMLDVVILGATEVDTQFNVNVTTSSDGIIMGGSGGHNDASAGAKLTIIVTTSTRSRVPIIRDRVTTVTTPGETVDVVVTERGIAVNPLRSHFRDRVANAGLPVRDISDLASEVIAMTGRPEPLKTGDRVVAINEYRDGSVIDVVRQVI